VAGRGSDAGARWYLESGADQAATLHLADERRAYASPISPPTRSSTGWRPAFCSPPTTALTNPYTLYLVRRPRRIPTHVPRDVGDAARREAVLALRACRTVRRRSCRGQRLRSYCEIVRGTGERAQLKSDPARPRWLRRMVQLPRVGDADRHHGAVRRRPVTANRVTMVRGWEKTRSPLAARDARGRQRPVT